MIKKITILFLLCSNLSARAPVRIAPERTPIPIPHKEEKLPPPPNWMITEQKLKQEAADDGMLEKKEVQELKKQAPTKQEQTFFGKIVDLFKQFTTTSFAGEVVESALEKNPNLEKPENREALLKNISKQLAKKEEPPPAPPPLPPRDHDKFEIPAPPPPPPVKGIPPPPPPSPKYDLPKLPIVKDPKVATPPPLSQKDVKQFDSFLDELKQKGKGGLTEEELAELDKKAQGSKGKTDDFLLEIVERANKKRNLSEKEIDQIAEAGKKPAEKSKFLQEIEARKELKHISKEEKRKARVDESDIMKALRETMERRRVSIYEGDEDDDGEDDDEQDWDD